MLDRQWNVARGTRMRILAVAIGCALAAVVAWIALHIMPAADESVHHDRAAVTSLLARRSTTAATASGTADSRRPEDRRWYMPIEDATKIFAVSARGQQYDPWCYYVHKPGLHDSVKWAEHPRGQWTYSTNSSGMRMDSEMRAEMPALRVLLTGDSHTEGFCDNADTFASRVEALLSAHSREHSVEVLNAADGGYSFHNYLGVLEKYVDLRPHVFVFTVHGGNDFKEVLLPHRYFARLPVLPESDAERERREAAEKVFAPALFQGLASISYFKDHPDDVDVALNAAVEIAREMKRICDEHAIGIVCVYLPSPVEVETERQADAIWPAARVLGIEERDIRTHAELGHRFLHALEALHVDVLDTTAAIQASKLPCFWHRDLHLALAGHEVIAHALEPVIARLAPGAR